MLLARQAPVMSSRLASLPLLAREAWQVRITAPSTDTAFTRGRASSSNAAQEAPRRCYLYHADVHAQLFLASVSPKNLTSCFKDAQFLDFFYRNIRPNPYTLSLCDASDDGASQDPHAPAAPAMSGSLEASDAAEKGPEVDYEAWDGPLLSPSKAAKEAHAMGFHWLSPCQGEQNFLSCAAGGTPVVFRELTGTGELKWGGTYTFPFQPHALRFDRRSGYVYHPSPLRPPSRTAAERGKRSASSRSERRADADEQPSASPFGAYSLLCSNLVLSKLSDGLDLDIAGQSHDPSQVDDELDTPRGSIEYAGERHPIRLLRPQDAGPWSALCGLGHK